MAPVRSTIGFTLRADSPEGLLVYHNGRLIERYFKLYGIHIHNKSSQFKRIVVVTHDAKHLQPSPRKEEFKNDSSLEELHQYLTDKIREFWRKWVKSGCIEQFFSRVDRANQNLTGDVVKCDCGGTEKESFYGSMLMCRICCRWQHPECQHVNDYAVGLGVIPETKDCPECDEEGDTRLPCKPCVRRMKTSVNETNFPDYMCLPCTTRHKPRVRNRTRAATAGAATSDPAPAAPKRKAAADAAAAIERTKARPPQKSKSAPKGDKTAAPAKKAKRARLDSGGETSVEEESGGAGGATTRAQGDDARLMKLEKEMQLIRHALESKEKVLEEKDATIAAQRIIIQQLTEIINDNGLEATNEERLHG
mmetsp:Transcript_60913/g.143910  ORF Transcript_60913/g.143910 Transcript_60913/m.143910 type:complete len:364 (+) Transcript_60913:1-1092(+)